MTTRTEDGVLLHGALAPAAGGKSGLLAVHGSWGNFYASPWFELLEEGPRRGITVLSMNTRGHDLGTLGDGGRSVGFARERFDDALFDLDAAADVLRLHGVERFVVAAHSFGGHRAAYWMSQREPEGAVGVVLASPAPELTETSRWFVDGSVGHHVARAARAIAEGRGDDMLVLSSSAPVPVVASAEVILETWGPRTPARAERYLPDVDVPMLITVGSHEPDVYRREASRLATSFGATFREVEDNHYYGQNRYLLARLVLDWTLERTEQGTIGARA